MDLDGAIALSDHQDGLRLLYQHILQRAFSVPAGIPFVEIGTRCGGTALLMLQAIKESGIFRPLFTVDPYGNKPFHRGNNIIDLEYGEDYYRKAMTTLVNYSNENRLFHYHWRMLSADFIRIIPQVEFWIEGQVQDLSKFGFVYLDGDHEEVCIANELNWFLPKMVKDGSIVIDDAEYIVNSMIPVIKDVVQNKADYVNSRLYYEVR